ncbi:hypothetical protein OG625_35535 [Streptomyces sp. NBC_01351]|uniref:hypothetical protein n=1 Tax=Streptomyces sp. NBC_01351 TaxID=2903833 RepID=UPI002E315331|nr:hypothetical protein [Streptomyces sp. NBC_01351]
MTHRRSSALRAYGCVAAGLLVLAGCSNGGGGKNGAGERIPAGAASGTASAAATPAPASSGTPTAPLIPELDESKQPRTAADARALIGSIAIGQEAFGPEVGRSTPFESDPARWPVLDADCVWQTEKLPQDVLATSTRYFQIPAKDGHGRVQINATVTVHRSRLESGWETARAMEEVLRCPDQRLRAGEELKGLWGASLYQGEQVNGWTEDAFTESGQYVGEEGGGPHPYLWSQGQFGPVTIAIAGKGAQGFTPEALSALVVQGTSRMMLQAHQELGKAAG